MDADLEVEAGFSMLVAGKKSLGGEKAQNYLPNNKSKTNYLPKNRIYLDSCYKYISFFNEWLLEDIRQIDTMLLGYTNAGTSKTNCVGNYGGVEAWLYISGIANIFSMPALKNNIWWPAGIQVSSPSS